MSYIVFLIISARLLLTVEGDQIKEVKIEFNERNDNNKTICKSRRHVGLKEDDKFKMIFGYDNIIKGSCNAGDNIYDLVFTKPIQNLTAGSWGTQDLVANTSMNISWQCIFVPKPTSSDLPASSNEKICLIKVIIEPNNKSHNGHKNMWLVIGSVIAFIVVVVIVGQTVLMLHFRAKARSQSLIQTLLRNNTENTTSDKARYSISPCKKLQVAAVTTNTTSDDGIIYESLDDLRETAAIRHGNQPGANTIQPPKTPIDISKRPPEPLPVEAIKNEGTKPSKPSKQNKLRKSSGQVNEVQKKDIVPTKEPIFNELDTILKKRREATTNVTAADSRPQMDSLQRSKSPRRNAPPVHLPPTNETPIPPKPLVNKPVMQVSLQRNKNIHLPKPVPHSPAQSFQKPLPASVQISQKRLPPPPVAEKPALKAPNNTVPRNMTPGLRLRSPPGETSKNIHTGFPNPAPASKRLLPPVPDVTQSQAYDAGFPSPAPASKRPPPPVPEVTQTNDTDNLYGNEDNEDNYCSDEDWCYEKLPEYNLYNI